MSNNPNERTIIGEIFLIYHICALISAKLAVFNDP